MQREMLTILADPADRTPLTLEEHEAVGSEIAQGTLYSRTGAHYPVINGIPRFVMGVDQAQRQTADSFAYKWLQYAEGDMRALRNSIRQRLIVNYGFGSADDMQAYFSSRRRVLDAGCGAGLSASHWLGPNVTEYIGADISTAIEIARERLGRIPHTSLFVQADVMRLPFKEQTFDTIFCEGVLHHTPSTELALKALVPLLEPGGELLFYVYRKKGPIREFTDDYVRSIIAEMSPEDGWKALMPLTRLGRALAELNIEVEVPEDIPYLGIEAGRYDVQRLFYWHVAKAFWSEELSEEENNLSNFDWYSPRYAHRQTEEEVRRWCQEAGLQIRHFYTQLAGFTVRAIKHSPDLVPESEVSAKEAQPYRRPRLVTRNQPASP